MPIPTVTELNEGKEDLDDLESLVNGTGNVQTRLGGIKPSYSQLTSALTHGDIEAYDPTETVTLGTQWRSHSGIVYRPIPSALPISPTSPLETSPNTAKWLAVQLTFDKAQERYPNRQAFIDSTPDPLTTMVWIDSFYPYGSAASPYATPKGGHFMWRTGATNTAPTVSTSPLPSASSNGTGTQAGYAWDASGAEWFYMADGNNANLYDFGLIDDSTGDDGTDNATAINNAITAGGNVEIRQISTGIRVGSAITMVFNRSFTGPGRRLATQGIRVGSAYGTDTPVFDMADSSIVNTVCVRGVTDGTAFPNHTPANRKGRAFNFDGDVKWCSGKGIAANYVNVGIYYGNGAYYNELQAPVVHNSNIGLHIDGTDSGALNIYGGHFRFNDVAVQCNVSGALLNNINLYGTSFEFNRKTITNDGEAELAFIGCYISDGNNTAVQTTGGTTTIDGLHQRSLGLKGSGAHSTYPTGSVPTTSDPTYSISSTGGRNIIKNMWMELNIHASLGFASGQWWNGADVLFNGATIETHDVRCLDYVPWSYQSGPFIEGTPIDNYVMNGAFQDAEKTPFDLQSKGSTAITITPHGTKRNIWGGVMQTLSGTADSTQQTVQVRYNVPSQYVGQVMYVVYIHGRGSNLTNPTLRTPDIDFTATGSYSSNTPATISAGVWPIGATDVFEDHPRVHWLPGTITNHEGYIEFQVTNGASGAFSLELYGILLVPAIEFCKLAPIRNLGLGRTVAGAAPTLGTWDLGEEVEDRTATLGGPPRRRNTSGGSPGTWRSYANLV